MKKVYLTQSSSFTAYHSHDGTLNEVRHEHHFNYQVTLHGPLNKEGYLVDFRDLDLFLKTVVNHRLNNLDLNTLFAHPTTENVAIWIFETVRAQFPQIVRVRLAEAPDRWAEYTGEEN